MGMSTHIRAFIPETDPEFQKHKKVLLICIEADVSLPKETSEYFGGGDIPHESLLEDKLEIALSKGTHFIDYTSEDSEGYEVDLTKLPEGVTKLRFYNNW